MLHTDFEKHREKQRRNGEHDIDDVRRVVANRQIHYESKRNASFTYLTFIVLVRPASRRDDNAH